MVKIKTISGVYGGPLLMMVNLIHLRLKINEDDLFYYNVLNMIAEKKFQISNDTHKLIVVREISIIY
jgi:hypothetical protein